MFSYLPVKVGDTMTDEKAAAAIKALFTTGFFKDVRLEIEGQVLVVVLEERPAIASLEFVGLKAFKADDLRKSLREVGLSESRIFDRALVERAEALPNPPGLLFVRSMTDRTIACRIVIRLKCADGRLYRLEINRLTRKRAQNAVDFIAREHSIALDHIGANCELRLAFIGHYQPATAKREPKTQNVFCQVQFALQLTGST